MAGECDFCPWGWDASSDTRNLLKSLYQLERQKPHAPKRRLQPYRKNFTPSTHHSSEPYRLMSRFRHVISLWRSASTARQHIFCATAIYWELAAQAAITVRWKACKCLPAHAIMVSLSISQSEERRAMGKKCHCGICVHDLFILEGGGLSAIFLPLDDFFTNHWACEVEEKKKNLMIYSSWVGLGTGNV